ncbi:hypothetical protein EB796_004806 [Bugula neritina]|uniref:Uncharacterized protein n=1 Tax=Bugula neritina TaxID=10212 RepID=A0A7J7KE03_BUGNE|nr:hypothetical protein EB796_004806 [Bugula neritina]
MLTVVVDPFLEAMHMERRDDDFLDKLNHKMSTTVMFILVFIQTFYQNQLLSVDAYNPCKEKYLLMSFVDDYLKCDGFITMKLMSCNANPLVAAGVIKQLWGIHRDHVHVWRKGHNIAPSPSPSDRSVTKFARNHL